MKVCQLSLPIHWLSGWYPVGVSNMSLLNDIDEIQTGLYGDICSATPDQFNVVARIVMEPLPEELDGTVVL